MRKCIPLILAFISLCLLSPAHAGLNIVRVPGDYDTIGEAVSGAQPGAMVIVGPGTYKENVVIRKPLFLRSSRMAKKTIITAADPDKPVIHVKDADNVTILGFTVKDSLIAGILVEKARGLMVMHNRALENENGAIIISADKGLVFGNVFDRNNSYGLYISKSSHLRVMENSASRNGDKGLFLFSSNKNRITNNRVNLNRWNGMLIWASNDNVITNNKTMRNMFGFVTGESDNNVVADNTSLPDLFLILPVFLVYIGFIFYLIQMYLFKVFSSTER